MIRAIIFDFFDVFRSDSYNRWLRKHDLEREGVYLTASEKHDRGEYSDKQFYQAVGDASGESSEQVKQEMETGNGLNKTLVEYLTTLKGQYKIALLSNSSSEYLRNELAKYDLEPYFDEIAISSEIGLIKPEPKIFRYITQKLSVEPTECVFIDDNPKHITAAEKLGLHGIVYCDVPLLKRQLQQLLG